QDPQAVETVWPYLGHKDRFIRTAARIAIEHQDPKTWRDRALAEKEPEAALNALIGLVRAAAADPFHRRKNNPPPDPVLKANMLDGLEQITWDRLDEDQRLAMLRVYGLVFNRMGKLDETARSKIIARFDAVYPSTNRTLNGELCQLLVYVRAPSVAKK